MGPMAGDHALDALHIETRVDAPTNVLVIDDDEGVRDVLAAWVEAAVGGRRAARGRSPLRRADAGP